MKKLQILSAIALFVVSMTSDAKVVRNRILILGDSHIQSPLGAQLDASLRAQNFDVLTYGVCGAVPRYFLSSIPYPCGYTKWWLDGKKSSLGYREAAKLRESGKPTGRTESLDTMLARLMPETVVVHLGANTRNLKNDNPQPANDIRQMAKKIADAGAKCLWIIPPHQRIQPRVGHGDFNSWIHQGASDFCTIIDPNLNPKFRYPASGGDGLHYWPKADKDPFWSPVQEWVRFTYQHVVSLQGL